MLDRPLAGTLVLDVSRMLPGAVLARMLLDLGARVIKIEDPRVGDPMRAAPPVVDGDGAGFRAFYRGAESVGLDLKTEAGAAALRQLASHADVLVESFRPGTLDKWGLGRERLAASNEKLVTVSLSGFGSQGPMSPRVAHDLNLVAMSGLLSQLPGTGLPRVQLADVTTGLLAGSAVLAGLLQRQRTGRGMHLDQPLAYGPLPFLVWARADAATGRTGMLGHVLAGEAPSYQRYTCQDGLELAVGAIEPKFWSVMLAGLALPELADTGYAVGPIGAEAKRQLASRFAEKPRDHWLAWAASENLPIAPVNDLTAAMRDPYYAEIHSFWPAWPGDANGVPPLLGEGTERVLAEFGLAGQAIADAHGPG